MKHSESKPLSEFNTPLMRYKEHDLNMYTDDEDYSVCTTQ